MLDLDSSKSMPPLHRVPVQISTPQNRFTSRNPTFQTANAIYPLPNDDLERERLIAQHRAYSDLLHGQLIQVPSLPPPRRVLDVGSGAGISTRELADLFPAAEAVVGLDLTRTPAEPEDARLRPNLRFVQGDFMRLAGGDGGEFGGASFDFVFHRLLVSGMTDWAGYAERVFGLLRPGGWAQMGDLAVDFYFDPATSDKPEGFAANVEWEWLRALRRGFGRRGLDTEAGANIPGHMRAAGFVDVRTTELVLPLWSGAVEARPEARACVEHHVGDPFGLWWILISRMLEGLDYAEAQIRRFQEDARRDLADTPGMHQIFYITVGRKPEAQ